MAHVYFLVMDDPASPARDFGLVKIGVTDGDVPDRVAELQTGNPFELRCHDFVETSCAREVEHLMHRKHAMAMKHREWIRCSRQRISELIADATDAAKRFERRAVRIRELIERLSNGKERAATQQELELHRSARDLHERLVPMRLKRDATASSIRASTGSTRGVPGIVRAERFEPADRFDPKIAERDFPELSKVFRITKIDGDFNWLDVCQRSHFADLHQAAAQAKVLEQEVEQAAVSAGDGLTGWIARSSELERHHETYLDATQVISQLEGELFDLKSELILLMGESDGLRSVCRYKRTERSLIDTESFSNAHPKEAAQCRVPQRVQIRKHIYLCRSYL